MPIKPGETYTFQIPIDLQQGWGKFNRRRGLRQSAPKKFRLIFQFLNFGGGWLGPRDAAFAAPRLWRDANHSGVSEPDELHTPPSLAVLRLDVDYEESERAGGDGNQSRHRAEVKDARGARAGRWAWDVFLVRAP